MPIARISASTTSSIQTSALVSSSVTSPGHDHPDQRAAQSDASSMPIRPMDFSVAPRNERAPRNHVDVWLCYENDVDEDLLRACAPPLIEAELAKAARFYFAADRNRHIIRCALLRTVLPRYLGISHQR